MHDAAVTDGSLMGNNRLRYGKLCLNPNTCASAQSLRNTRTRYQAFRRLFASLRSMGGTNPSLCPVAALRAARDAEIKALVHLGLDVAHQVHRLETWLRSRSKPR